MGNGGKEAMVSNGGMEAMVGNRGIIFPFATKVLKLKSS